MAGASLALGQPEMCPSRDLASPRGRSASGATTGTAFPRALHHRHRCRLRDRDPVLHLGHRARVHGVMGEWVTLSMVVPRALGLYAPGSRSVPVTSPEPVPGVRQVGLAPLRSPAPHPMAAGPEQQHSPASLRANPPPDFTQRRGSHCPYIPLPGGPRTCRPPWRAHPTAQPRRTAEQERPGCDPLRGVHGRPGGAGQDGERRRPTFPQCLG